MSYSSTAQLGIVEGGCLPAEFRTVYVDERGASVGLGPCVSTCSGLETITSDGRQCMVVGAPPAAEHAPPSWSPFVLAGAAALAVLIVLR